MPWPVHPNGLLGAQGDNDTYKIERSLRFNSADSAYLSRTPASASNRKTWTWSGWVKRSNLGTTQVFYSASETGSSSQLFFDTSDRINIFSNVASINVVSTPRYRDVSSWYHILVSLDTTQATVSDRVKLYVNGTRVTAFEGSTYYPSQNAEPNINNTTLHALGAQVASGSITAGVYLSSYLTEINFIDGQALTPSSFGETDAITGRWKAKAYSGTYGTNGFYLKFADNSSTAALGTDSSGNGNTWTPNNFSVTAGAGNDSLVDSPTNYGSDTGVGGEVRGNYCTLSGIDSSAGASGFTLTNGNLQYNKSGDSGNSRIRGTVFVGSGKYYWEYNITSVGAAGLAVGVATTQYRIGTVNDTPYRAYTNTGNKASGASATSYGSSWTANDVVGVALNMDAGSIVFYKNNISQGTAFTDLSGSSWTSWIQGEGVLNCNFGQRPFAYTAPTGFKALCTTNLTTPTIKKPSSYFDTVTYTGTGANQTISVPGFTPDFVWIKSRGAATNHRVYDTTRGTNYLVTNSTAAEVGSGTFAFSGNGFIVSTDSDINSNGTQYVSWAWDEAPIAGMDVVSFASPSGTTQSTVGHNLGVAPKMIIAKNRDTGANNWAVFHSSVCDTTSKFLQLNTTAALQTFATVWGASLPTSSVFGVTGGGVAASGVNCIAYLFAEVEGFSKFGSYTGNGLADGPFVWCGFRPRWVMYKRTDAIATWNLLDTSRDLFNASNNYLTPNSNAAEASGGAADLLDIVSNGFKARGSGGSTNASGGTYIFAAFAESPFKYARAR